MNVATYLSIVQTIPSRAIGLCVSCSGISTFYANEIEEDEHVAASSGSLNYCHRRLLVMFFDIIYHWTGKSTKTLTFQAGQDWISGD